MENNQRQSFSNYTVVDSHQIPAGAISKKFMATVFMWMFVALGISAVLAIAFATNESLTAMLYQPTLKGLRPTGLGMAVRFAPLAFILVISFGFNRLSSAALTGIFIAFAAVMGMSLSVWLMAFESASVIGCFASSSAMFGIMAVMGYTTDKDLTSFGSILTMGLVGIIIASMINMFLGSAMMQFIISIIGVAVFTGLTAYDVQKLKRIGAGLEYEGTAGDTRKLAIMGALSLYLDFVNIFLYMLSLFGKRR